MRDHQAAISGPLKKQSWDERLAASIVFLAFLFVFDVITPNFSTEIVDTLARIAQKRTISANQAAGSVISQLFWLGLMAMGTVLILWRANNFLRYLPSVALLIILMIWSVMSTFWSAYGLITFRRSVLLVIIFLSLYVAITYSERMSTTIKAAYYAAFAALFLDVISLGLPSGYHQAVGPLSGNFKGIHGHKNGAGKVAVIALFLGVLVRPYLLSGWQRLCNSFFLLGWFGLLILTVSKSSIALFFFAPLIVYLANFVSRVFSLSLGWVLLSVVLSLIFSLTMLDATLGMGLGDLLIAITGQEVTFTGRTYIWAYIFQQLEQNWLLGYGFGGFWGVGDDAQNIKTGIGFISGINQAHNGYIDLIINVGLIGALLFSFVLVEFSRNMERIRDGHQRIYFLFWTMITFALLHNTMESSIIRTTSLIWVTMLFVLLLGSRVRTY